MLARLLRRPLSPEVQKATEALSSIESDLAISPKTQEAATRIKNLLGKGACPDGNYRMYIKPQEVKAYTEARLDKRLKSVMESSEIHSGNKKIQIEIKLK